MSMTLHEAAHAYAGYWLGDDTAKLNGRLTLNPIAHIDPVLTLLMPLLMVIVGLPPFGAAKPVPFNPMRLRFGEYGAAIVGVAGPLVNLLLAVLAGLSLRFIGSGISPLFGEILSVFVIVNLSFFLFNMIPFPPLDGSRLLYVFAPDVVRNVMQRIEYSGVLALLGFYFVFYTFLSTPFIKILGILFSLLTAGTSGV